MLSEVSALDDCDIGSGVHSKVNLFAVALVSTLKLTFLPLTWMFACHGSWSSRELTEVGPLHFILFLDSTIVMTPNMTSSSSSSLWRVFLEWHIAA